MPRLPRRRGVLAYDFAGNMVPGVRQYEEGDDWRDIGTVEAYEAAHRDVLGPGPLFSLMNTEWPICGDAPN